MWKTLLNASQHNILTATGSSLLAGYYGEPVQHLLSLSGRQQLYLTVWHYILTYSLWIKHVSIRCLESAYWTEKIRQEQSEDQ